MSSPTKSRAEHLIESEIRQHINYFSPSKNDLDFYQRKVGRLQGDLNQLQEELSIARLRLRTAEDFEIKYELLMKQNNSLLHENAKLTRDLAKKKAETEQLHGDIHSYELIKADLERTLLKRAEEFKQLQRRTDESEQALQLIRSNTQNSDFEHQLEQERVQYEKSMKDFSETISKLTKTNTSFSLEINRLQSRIDELEEEIRANADRHAILMDRVRQEWSEKLKHKEVEIDKIKESHHQLSGVSLEDLRNRIEEKDEIFAKELELLKDVLAVKSREVDETIMDKKRIVGGYETELDELRAVVNSLQDKLHESQIANQLELYNMKERLTKLHAEDLSSRDKAKEQIVQEYAKDLANLKQIVATYEEEMTLLRAKHEKDLNEHKLVEEHLKKGIYELKERIHEHNLNADSQHQIMTSLNLDLEEQKKASSSDYSNNITFLDQQLKRVNVSLEQKNLEAKILIKQLSDVKRQCDIELKDSEAKWAKERAELEGQLDKIVKEKKIKDEQLKKKDKQLRSKDRDLEDLNSKIEAERKAMQRALDEAHNDYKRLAQDSALLQRVVRQERIKGVGSMGDLNNIRRDKLADLDKQRSELEAIFREQMDQIRSTMQLENDKLRVERDRLKSELQQLKLHYGELDENFKRISALVANEARTNKDKLAEYQMKMATLNMEINMAQNLYSSFLDAKSRINKGADKENL